MEKYEIQKLRELPIEAVAERLGLQVSRHRALCPFHDDTHPSLSFYTRKNTYHCFVCGAHGGTIDLVMNYLHKDFVEACRWLAEEHSLPMLTRVAEPKERAEKPFDAERYERFFRHPCLNDAAKRFLFEERKLSEQVVSYCRLTSWRDNNGTSRLTIPYFNKEGKLVGIQNRNLANGEKRFPSGARCSIYNLQIINLLKPGDELWITEGASDCWAMLSSKRYAIAIPSATLLTHESKETLRELHSSLPVTWHMYPDNDVAGERLFLQLREILPTLERHPLPQGCKDYSLYYLQLVKQQPS